MNPSSPCRIDVRESGLRPWRELVPLGDAIGSREAFEASCRVLPPDTDVRLVIWNRTRAQRNAVQYDGLGVS
jgi:hypothetical protein